MGYLAPAALRSAHVSVKDLCIATDSAWPGKNDYDTLKPCKHDAVQTPDIDLQGSERSHCDRSTKYRS